MPGGAVHGHESMFVRRKVLLTSVKKRSISSDLPLP